ncbi:MAG: cation diffusion facilitator family transporter [Sterolibacteriaceae bacterium MAG5]|nr:cation diffusion facilitator family transporter [Candidatus Nitricoxidireducens bremensis]
MGAEHHHPRTESGERYAEGRRITWVSVVVNVILTAMQVVVGVVAHSQSLIADAMHTLSDVVADGFVLWANRRSAEAADADHPYGHGRYETAASLVLGLLLMATGAGILLAAAGRLQDLGNAPAVGVAAVWAALATLAAKEGLFRYMLATAERLRSPMLVANAWHARADALSSLVVAAGVGGSVLGFPYADAVAAIVVGGMIVKAGAGFAWEAIRELIDTGLDVEEVATIRRVLAQTPGVVDLHDLRTRRMAHKALVDAHIRVASRISVSEGHRVAESARRRVLAECPQVLDVLVHVDAEDDSRPGGFSPIELPGREALIERLALLLDLAPGEMEKVLFHYLGRKVEAEVFLSPRLAGDLVRLATLRERVEQGLATDPVLGAISLHCRIAPK